MTAIVAALQFLLVTPALVRRAFTAQELGRATAFYPLVGLLLGGLLALADLLLGYLFPIQVRSALVLALWIVLTGALHFDGLLTAATVCWAAPRRSAGWRSCAMSAQGMAWLAAR
jgi:adenosylcobinamide-GDP ribazoletransferase